jgi:signal transduction histidine kinase
MVLVVGMTALVVLAFAIPLAVLIRHNVYNDALRSLQSEANSIALFLRGESPAPTTDEITAYLKTLDPDRRASVELPNGQVIGTPPPGGATAAPSLPTGEGGPFGGPGGSGDNGHDRGGPPQTQTASFAGGQLTQLQVPAPGGTDDVRVYASNSELHSGETGWWLLLAGASLGLLLFAAGAAELLTRRIVRPLTDTAETARALSVGNTTARAPTDGPREIGEVGVALNRLADRIDQLIAEERETVADLSHRLRTPLTALRLDAEALRDPADAERVGTHVSALERMLTAVIHAARRPQREGRMPSCDATAVVRERVSFWSALTEDQQRPSSVSLPSAPVVVRAAPEDLAAAVDALLENVVAHTPEGTAFTVRLTPTSNGGRLEVCDDGPGLPRDEPVRGRSDRGSSGLGLDIARRCAEASGGSMTLGAGPSGGARITLDLLAP